MELLTTNINIDINVNATSCIDIVAKHIGIIASEIQSCRLHKLSIDARKKNGIHYVASYIVTTSNNKTRNTKPYKPPQDIFCQRLTTVKQNIVVVGAGPSGLMSALLLAMSGCNVTVVERGSDIDKRVADVQRFFDGGKLDVNSNIQFGLGGAGTFSDGKLTTGTSSALTYSVFNELVRCGAPQDILYSNMPHIGTDNLVNVVANMRDKIIAHGGNFIFDTTVSDIIVSNNTVSGVKITDNVTNNSRVLHCDSVILAIGHSARQSYDMLKQHLEIAPKPFAVGLRIEHSRQMISLDRYGKLSATHRDLASASYKLATTLPSGRSCYSFCMCPGGMVVPATSQEKAVVVNGMSNYDRLADNSNSALVVNVNVSDYYQGDQLDGVAFVSKLESDAYNIDNACDNYAVPAQNVVDFLAKRLSKELCLDTSYPLGCKLVNLWDILPSFVAESIAQALLQFDKQIKGFATSGILLAVESRTSSPITIVRDKQRLCSTKIANLYPIGEGAGYAGGIVSASVDGLRVACKILNIDYN